MRVKIESFLREVCEKTTQNNEYPVLTSSKSGLFLQSDYFNKQVASTDNTGYKIIKKGQFTYRAMSDTGEFYPNMLECVDVGIVSPAYPVFEIFQTDIIIPEYLKYYFKSNAFQHAISSFAQGSTRTSVKFNKLKTASIDLPSKQEQTKILRLLKKAETLIACRQQELHKLDDLVKARFVEMFGDPVDNSKHFDLVPLGQLGVLKRGVSKHRPRNDAVLLGGNFPLIQTGDVSNAKDYITEYTSTYSEEGLKQSKMWGKGTLCITIAANIADTAILNFDACFPDSVVGFIPNEKVTTLFIHNWFKFLQPVLEENAPAVAQKNLNVATLEKTGVIVPPIEMQNEFEIFVQQIDKSKFVESIHVLKLIKEAIAKEVSHDRIR